MTMKGIIYSVLIGLCLVVSAGVLILYYNQDVSANTEFVSVLNVSDLETTFESSQRWTGEEYVTDTSQYLSSAIGTVGTTTLTNNGMFDYIYKAPRYLGCIEQLGEQDSGASNQVSVLIDDSSGSEYNRYGYYSEQRVEVPSGVTKTFYIKASYYVYDQRITSVESLKGFGVNVYEIPSKEENPLGSDYSYDSFYYNPSCANVEDKLERIAHIILS